ncbi:helix-turn-helix domain-containing protein [Pseudomonas sp. LABIM340]|uniref:helix-turn-helix domain-containing protein n=1 Tax=Pseudomonas sp. LABIM340 TaxID=3156585 RepID=UPI0032B023FB
MPKSTATPVALPTEMEVVAAAEALRVLEPLLSAEKTLDMRLVSSAGGRRPIAVPTLALHLLVNLLNEIASGNAVKVVPIQAELTTQEGADLLNVSRPHLVKLLDEGVIPHTKTGRHRRVKLADLVAFKETREQTSQTAMDQLAAEAQALVMGY